MSPPVELDLQFRLVQCLILMIRTGKGLRKWPNRLAETSQGLHKQVLINRVAEGFVFG